MGVEAVWALITPKQISQTNKVQTIACAAIYSKPGHKHKSDMLDHISEAFNIVNAKFGKGTHFIVSGDTNELMLKPIMDISPNFVQIVNKPTRIDNTTGKKAMLDPVIMTLSIYYQEAEVLAPLDSDPDKDGKPSDHKIVKVKPISNFCNKNARITRKIEVQPITESGIRNMKAWLMEEDWNNVLEAETTDHKTRRSEKWKVLDQQFKKKVKESKSNFYKNMVADLKEKDPKQWYSMVKRIASYENKNEQIIVEEINNLPDKVQCELIADEFSKIPNEYTPLHSDDIVYPSFETRDIPQFKEATVWKKLVSIKVKAYTRKGGVPAKLFKMFAAYIAEPLTNIFNSNMKSGQYPKMWKHKIATPIPKVHP